MLVLSLLEVSGVTQQINEAKINSKFYITSISAQNIKPT